MSETYAIRSVHAQLLDGPLRFAAGEVLQVHRRSLTARVRESLVTFARAELGDGPLGVLVAGEWPPPGLAAGDVVRPVTAGWQVGGCALALRGSARWEPPAPPAIGRARWASVRAVLGRAVSGASAGGALAALGLVPGGSAAGFDALVARRLGEEARRLDAALAARDGARMGFACARLVGVGGGLTPAGDDLLTGLLTFLMRAREPLAAGLVPIALSAGARTTPVAAHMLQWAADGVVNAHLLALADAAVAGDAPALLAALPAALAHGASSGGDFAAGVWLGLGCGGGY